MIALLPIGAQEQPPQRFGDRCEGLVLGEPAHAKGDEPVGTKPLPRNGSSSRNIGRLLAVSTPC
jgi:hypothetical protein